MAILTAMAAPTFDVLPADIYTARIAAVHVEERDPDQYHTEAYQCFVIDFALTALPGRTIRDWATVPKFFSELAKATKLLRAAGLPIPNGRYDTDRWIGAELRLNIIEVPGRDGGMRNKIESYVQPPPAARRTMPTDLLDEEDDLSDVPF